MHVSVCALCALLLWISGAAATATEVTAWIHSYDRTVVFSAVPLSSKLWTDAASVCASYTYQGQPGVFEATDSFAAQRYMVAAAAAWQSTFSSAGTYIAVAINGALQSGQWTWQTTGVAFADSARNCLAGNFCNFAATMGDGGAYLVARIGFTNADTMWYNASADAFTDPSGNLKGVYAFCSFASPQDAVIGSLAAEQTGGQHQWRNWLNYDGSTLALMAATYNAYRGNFLVTQVQGIARCGYYLVTPGDAFPVLMIGAPSNISWKTTLCASCADNTVKQSTTFSSFTWTSNVQCTSSFPSTNTQRPVWVSGDNYLFPSLGAVYKLQFTSSGASVSLAFVVLFGSARCVSTYTSQDYSSTASAATVPLQVVSAMTYVPGTDTTYLGFIGSIGSVVGTTGTLTLFAGSGSCASSFLDTTTGWIDKMGAGMNFVTALLVTPDGRFMFGPDTGESNAIAIDLWSGTFNAVAGFDSNANGGAAADPAWVVNDVGGAGDSTYGVAYLNKKLFFAVQGTSVLHSIWVVDLSKLTSTVTAVPAVVSSSNCNQGISCGCYDVAVVSHAKGTIAAVICEQYISALEYGGTLTITLPVKVKSSTRVKGPRTQTRTRRTASRSKTPGDTPSTTKTRSETRFRATLSSTQSRSSSPRTASRTKTNSLSKATPSRRASASLSPSRQTRTRSKGTASLQPSVSTSRTAATMTVTRRTPTLTRRTKSGSAFSRSTLSPSLTLGLTSTTSKTPTRTHSRSRRSKTLTLSRPTRSESESRLPTLSSSGGTSSFSETHTRERTRTRKTSTPTRSLTFTTSRPKTWTTSPSQTRATDTRKVTFTPSTTSSRSLSISSSRGSATWTLSSTKGRTRTKRTATMSRSHGSSSMSAFHTPSPSPSLSTSPTVGQTASSTRTRSVPTPSMTLTSRTYYFHNVTPTGSASESFAASRSLSFTKTPSSERSVSPSTSPSITRSASRERSTSRSVTRSVSVEATLTESRTRTPPRVKTKSVSPPVTETRRPTATFTHAPSPSITRTITPPPTPTRTRTETPSKSWSHPLTTSPSQNVTRSPSRSAPTLTRSPTRRSISLSWTNSSSMGTVSYSVDVTISLSDSDSRVLTPRPSRSPTHKTVSSSPTINLTDSVTVAATPSREPTPSETPFVDQPDLSNTDRDSGLTVSIQALTTVGTATGWLEISRGGSWATLASATPSDRRFDAAFATPAPPLFTAPPGVIACAKACRVVGFSPTSLPLLGEVLGCNTTHLALGFWLVPQAHPKGTVAGRVAVALDCLVRQPSRGRNISAAFRLLDDRPTTPVTVSRTVVQTTQTVAAVASIASVANPALASQASRMALILSLPFCQGGFNAPALSDSPTQMSVGDPDADWSPLVGAVIGNSVLVLSFGLLQLGAATAWWYHRSRTRRPKTWLVCVADTRFPGLLIVPTLMFLQYTTGGVLVAFAYADGSAAVIVVGLVGLVVVVSAPASIGTLLLRYRYMRFHAKEEPKDDRIDKAAAVTPPATTTTTPWFAGLSRADFALAFNRFFHGTGKWVATDDMRQVGVPFARYFGMLVTDYRQRTFWYVLVEVLTNIILGVLSVIDLSDITVCRGVAFTTAAVFVIYALLLAIGRPYHASFNNVVLIPCAVAQSVGAVLVTCYVYTDGSPQWDWMLSIGSLLPTIVTYVMMAKTLVDLTMMILEGACRIYEFLTKKKSSWMAFLDTSDLRDDDFDDAPPPVIVAATIAESPDALPMSEDPLELLGVRGLDAVPQVVFTDDGNFVGPTETPTVLYDEKDQWRVKPRATTGFQFHLGGGGTDAASAASILDSITPSALDKFLCVTRPSGAPADTSGDDEDDDGDVDADAARVAHEAYLRERARLTAMLGGRSLEVVERELVGDPTQLVSRAERDALARSRGMRAARRTAAPYSPSSNFDDDL